MKSEIYGYSLLIVTVALVMKTSGLLEITNIKCTSVDKSYTDFEYCFIKSVNRSYKYFSVKANLLKVPVDNVTINFNLKRNSNGYKLFLFNVTMDACKYLREENHNVLLDFAYSLIKYHSNMNHTCPFDHDIIVDKLDVTFLESRVDVLFPVPNGEYAMFTSWSAYNKLRAVVTVYGRLTR